MFMPSCIRGLPFPPLRCRRSHVRFEGPACLCRLAFGDCRSRRFGVAVRTSALRDLHVYTVSHSEVAASGVSAFSPETSYRWAEQVVFRAVVAGYRVRRRRGGCLRKGIIEKSPAFRADDFFGKRSPCVISRERRRAARQVPRREFRPAAWLRGPPLQLSAPEAPWRLSKSPSCSRRPGPCPWPA